MKNLFIFCCLNSALFFVVTSLNSMFVIKSIRIPQKKYSTHLTLNKPHDITILTEEERSTIVSIQELEDCLTRKIKTALQPIIVQSLPGIAKTKDVAVFLSERKKDSSVMQLYCQKKNDDDKLIDKTVAQKFLKELNQFFIKFNFNINNILVVSSSYFNSDGYESTNQSDILKFLELLYSSASKDILDYWKNLFAQGAVCLAVAGVVNRQSNIVVPPMILVSDKIDHILDNYPIGFTKDIMSVQVGLILRYYINMRWYIFPYLDSDESKIKYLYNLSNLQDQIGAITCDMYDAEWALENNMYLKKDGIRLSEGKDRLLLLERFLLSELIVKCHRNEGRIE